MIYFGLHQGFTSVLRLLHSYISIWNLWDMFFFFIIVPTALPDTCCISDTHNMPGLSKQQYSQCRIYQLLRNQKSQHSASVRSYMHVKVAGHAHCENTCPNIQYKFDSVCMAWGDQVNMTYISIVSIKMCSGRCYCGDIETACVTLFFYVIHTSEKHDMLYLVTSW